MPTHPADKILRVTALLCVAAVAFALVSQHVFGLLPCAWCVLQRLILLAIAAVALLSAAGWRGAWWRRIGGLLVAGLSASGVVAAWYQYSVAAHSFSCARTFADRLISDWGLDAALPWLFGIYSSCMDASVTLLGLEYALWALILFAITLVMGLAALLLSVRWRQDAHP